MQFVWTFSFPVATAPSPETDTPLPTVLARSHSAHTPRRICGAFYYRGALPQPKEVQKCASFPLHPTPSVHSSHSTLLSPRIEPESGLNPRHVTRFGLALLRCLLATAHPLIVARPQSPLARHSPHACRSALSQRLIASLFHLDSPSSSLLCTVVCHGRARIHQRRREHGVRRPDDSPAGHAPVRGWMRHDE
ncbi:hypothetical protein MSAN_00261300 [Mycena sanguinolenta]|uniref:Uncharacterized protein n=1 Tax=Mycena sanguinolenta TaxID=230812 RepID=A0A8H6ZG50_9AGAR|nr:hypothetical protein MSAN_00261300 [Mycena sanguinolenta]